MKSIIYTIKVSKEYTHKQFKALGSIYWDANKWGKITEDRLKSYAEETGSSLKVFSGPASAELPDFVTPFQRITWLKFDIFEHFVKSGYDKMLYLDLDVYVKRKAPNIFEEFSKSGFNMSLDKNSRHQKVMETLLKTDHVHNAGVICVDRPAAERFYENTPQKNQWESFLKGKENPYGLAINEQVVISSIIQKHNIDVNLFDPRKWNISWENQSEDSNFVHYYGVLGKLILHKLSACNKAIDIRL